MLKYYEVNGRGNALGQDGLACPICGNAAVSDSLSVGAMIVTCTESGGLLLSVDNVGGESLVNSCPQCGIVMVSHEEIVKIHKKDGCPGCLICGSVKADIFKTCTSCVIAYDDIARGGCDGCPFNYSRGQMGIDIYDIKEYYNIETIPGEQEELFPISGLRRNYYADRTGKAAG